MSSMASKMYLSSLCSRDHPEQEAASRVAKNRDLLWYVIPFLGSLAFCLTIEARYEAHKGNK